MKKNNEYIFLAIAVGIFAFFFIFWIMTAKPAEAALGYLNTASSTTTGTNLNFDLNIGSQSDKMVLVSVFVNDGASNSTSTATYGGQTLNLLSESYNSTQEHIFTFGATTTLDGTNAFDINLSNSKTFSAVASAFNGVSGNLLEEGHITEVSNPGCSIGPSGEYPRNLPGGCQINWSVAGAGGLPDISDDNYFAFVSGFTSNWPRLTAPTASTSLNLIDNSIHGGTAYDLFFAPQNDIDINFQNLDSTSRRSALTAVFIEGGSFEGFSGSLSFTTPTDSATTTTNFDAEVPPANPWAFSYDVNSGTLDGENDFFQLVVNYWTYATSTGYVYYQDKLFFSLSEDLYPLTSGTILVDKSFYLQPGNWTAAAYLYPMTAIGSQSGDAIASAQIDFVVDNTGVPVFGYPSNYIPFQLYELSTSTATSSASYEEAKCTGQFWDPRNWKNCLVQGAGEVFRFLILPHDFSTTFLKNAFFNFQNVFPFNIFFNFENAISNQAQSVALSNPEIRLPYPDGSGENFVVMSSSTIASYIGSTWYDNLRTAEEYIIWLFTGTIIIFMIF